MNRISRPVLLIASGVVVVVLLGGGFALRVGAAESSFRQPARFAEILSLVMENYVDEVPMDGLLEGAYEGMLGGLDPNGAFLTPDEVAEWQRGAPAAKAEPGIGVLRVGRSLQVISVVPGSPAAEAGIEVGDQIRGIGGRLVRDVSLQQARRLLVGAPGSSVTLETYRPHDNFRRQEVEIVRALPQGRAYELKVVRGTAVLTLRDWGRVSLEELNEELDDVRSRGVERLLLDLRDIADGDPRQIAGAAGLFADTGTLLRLRDRSGRQIEAVEGVQGALKWSGSLSVLVNGATAGAAEALAAIAREMGGAKVYGESTYGLGAEPRLYQLEGGYGLLVSARLWETASGSRWNVDGVSPDEVVRGSGSGYAEAREDQLNQVLDLLESDSHEVGTPRAA